MKKKNDSKMTLPGHEHIPGLDDYDLAPHIEVDYSKAKPNSFAGKVKFTHGGARKNAGRKPGQELLIAKHVYLYPRHLKRLEKISPNLSQAIRQLVDNQR
jgi:hypothetical protein